MAYSVTLELSTSHKEWKDITSWGESAWETKRYNNELCKNGIDHLVF